MSRHGRSRRRFQQPLSGLPWRGARGEATCGLEGENDMATTQQQCQVARGTDYPSPTPRLAPLLACWAAPLGAAHPTSLSRRASCGAAAAGIGRQWNVGQARSARQSSGTLREARNRRRPCGGLGANLDSHQLHNGTRQAGVRTDIHPRFVTLWQRRETGSASKRSLPVSDGKLDGNGRTGTDQRRLLIVVCISVGLR